MKIAFTTGSENLGFFALTAASWSELDDSSVLRVRFLVRFEAIALPLVLGAMSTMDR